MAIILKNCRYLITQNESREILEHADVHSEGNAITKTTKADIIIDCSNHIVMPGLVNMHTHLGMTFLRGAGEDMELMDWLQKKIFPAEKKIRDHDVYRWAYHGAREALRFGTTTVCDSYFFPFSTAKALEDMGMRGFVGSDVQDGKTPHAATTEEALQLSELFLDAYKTNPLITPIAFAHSPYTCSEKTLRAVKKLAEKYKTHFSLHLAETRDEVTQCKKRYGAYPVEAMAKLGFCDKKTILAHCNWITKDEIKLLKGACIVHNPISNMKLASGSTLPLPELFAAGIAICLGTDSVTSNNNLDMFEEMKVAGLLQKFHRWDPTALPVQHILDMATRNAGMVLGKKIGIIQPGYLADIIVLDINDHLLPIDKERVLNHLVYSAKGSDVATVIINGEIRYRDGKIMPKVTYEHTSSAATTHPPQYSGFRK